MGISNLNALNQVKKYCSHMYKGYILQEQTFKEVGPNLYSVYLKTEFEEIKDVTMIFHVNADGGVQPMGISELD
jgi:hypothetical protein